MTKNKTFLICFAVAMIALVAGIYTGQKTSGTPQQIAPALAAGSIDRLFASKLTDPTGKPQAFSQWKGKTLVVNFWATWCPPCREEMPGFSRLQSKHAANGVQFVGIALDSADSVQAFSKQFPVTYPLLIGGDEGTDLARQLGNPRLAMPFTVLINPAGEARFARLGGVSETELESLLQQSAHR